MSSSDRWRALPQLKGWTICRDFERAVEQAHRKRHPKHDSYVPSSERRQLTEAESKRYDRLNEWLHEQLRKESKKHFKSVPVPTWVQEKRGDETLFPPFTYQNLDWYGPSYECYIVVLADFISADLLRRFQLLLHDTLEDWCIRIVGSKDVDLDDDYELAVFSDQILLTRTVANALQITPAHRRST
jgi:hypothetical protein